MKEKKHLSKLQLKSMKLESMGAIKGGDTFTIFDPSSTAITCQGSGFLEDEHYILSERDTEYQDA